MRNLFLRLRPPKIDIFAIEFLFGEFMWQKFEELLLISVSLGMYSLCIIYAYSNINLQVVQSKMLFIGSPSNLFLLLNKMRNFAEFIFEIERIWEHLRH